MKLASDSVPDIHPTDAGPAGRITWPARCIDLWLASYSPTGVIYQNDPCANATEDLYTCPAGFYAVITHVCLNHACAGSAVVAVNYGVRREGVEVPIYMQSHQNDAAGVAGPMIVGIDIPFALDEGDTLVRNSSAVPAAGGLRIVLLKKVMVHD